MADIFLPVLQAALFAITPFIAVMLITFLFRIFAKEDFPMWMGVFVGLAFIGVELTEITEAKSLDIVLKFIFVMIISAWAVRFGNQLAGKVPTHNLGSGGYHLLKRSISKVSGKRFIEITLPKASEIDNIYGKKPVREELRNEVGGKKFVLPADLPIEILELRIKRRLINDWRVGDAEVKMDEHGTIVRLALSAKKTRISSIIPEGEVLFSFKPESVPFEIGYGDSINIITGSLVVRKVEVLNATEDTISVIMKPKDAEKLSKRIAKGATPSIIVYPHLKVKYKSPKKASL
jgi:hypothetical protein